MSTDLRMKDSAIAFSDGNNVSDRNLRVRRIHFGSVSWDFSYPSGTKMSMIPFALNSSDAFSALAKVVVS